MACAAAGPAASPAPFCASADLRGLSARLRVGFSPRRACVSLNTRESRPLSGNSPVPLCTEPWAVFMSHYSNSAPKTGLIILARVHLRCLCANASKA